MADLTLPLTRPPTRPLTFPLNARGDLGTGGSAASYASSPAPDGYRWDFVTFNGASVTFNGEPVVSLVRIN